MTAAAPIPLYKVIFDAMRERGWELIDERYWTHPEAPGEKFEFHAALSAQAFFELRAIGRRIADETTEEHRAT